MSNYDDLDKDLFEHRGISIADSTIFLHALRKYAAEGAPADAAAFPQHNKLSAEETHEKSNVRKVRDRTGLQAATGAAVGGVGGAVLGGSYGAHVLGKKYPRITTKLQDARDGTAAYAKQLADTTSESFPAFSAKLRSSYKPLSEATGKKVVRGAKKLIGRHALAGSAALAGAGALGGVIKHRDKNIGSTGVEKKSEEETHEKSRVRKVLEGRPGMATAGGLAGAYIGRDVGLELGNRTFAKKYPRTLAGIAGKSLSGATRAKALKGAKKVLGRKMLGAAAAGSGLGALSGVVAADISRTGFKRRDERIGSEGVEKKASGDEASAHAAVGQPDETGRLEGEFAVPVEQVVMTLAQIVSNSMRQHTAYAYYSEMMRDVGRGELAELFDHQARGEISEMHYFLRRMSVLQPGGVPIPVAPTPEPSSDVQVALKYLISGEQQAIVLFKTLHSMLGDNPMKYTLEQTMTDAQKHLDSLWQYMPATPAPTSAAKIAAAALRIKRAAPNQPEAAPGAVPVGAPGTEPLSAVLSREAMLQQSQLMAENQDLRSRVDAATQAQLVQQQQLESTMAENQNLQAMSQESSGQAQAATEQASMSAEQAAQQADAKMRLSIRIQQLRQSLADIVSQDPVQEEGVGFGEQATAGSVTTSSQQGQMQQADAAAEAEMAGLGPEANKEQQQAARAQGEAKQQSIQADAAKSAGLFDAVDRHLVRASENAVEAGVNRVKSLASRDVSKLVKNPKARLAAAAGALAVGGTAVRNMKRQNDRDDVQKKILEAVQARK